MFRKLLLTMLIYIVIIVGLGGIALAEENEIEIAFIRATGEPYYQYGSQAAEVAAKKLGVKMVVYTSNLDSAQELANVQDAIAVSYTHLRAHETVLDLVCRLLLEKKKTLQKKNKITK